MEDEQEIQSHASPAGYDSPDSSPSPTPPIGQITVAVAASSPPSSPLRESNALALALPVKACSTAGNISSSSNGRASGGGREDCWSEGATAVLIDSWGERYLELSRGNLKQKHWKEVAEIVSGREDYTKAPKTDIQCKNRIDTVKKKYKQEKVRMAAGGSPSCWIFFEKLDRLIGSTAKILNPGSQKVPVGIPTSSRSNLHHHKLKPTQVAVKRSNESKRWRFKKRNASESESESEPELSADSADSLPPPPPLIPPPPKRARTEKKETGGGSKWGELTRAVLRFGEAYEEAERAKIQQLVEIEKERMKFVKELELQRMQFFVKTQLEISQLRHGGRRTGNSSNDNGGNWQE